MSATDPARHFPSGEVIRPGKQQNRFLVQISRRLRERDYVIADLLDEHTTLTTDQLTAILFTSPITCRHRLGVLRSISFVDNFVRHRPGTPVPVFWVPGLLSARLLAMWSNETAPTERALRERQDRVFANPTWQHLHGTNDFFVALQAYARTHPGHDLSRWWSERSTHAKYGRHIQPDGHGVWTDGDREVGFFLEYDRGTETIGTLAKKLDSYRNLYELGGPAYPLLFVLPTRVREQNLHRRLTQRGDDSVVVATTSPESGTHPADAIWRLVGNGRHRLRLSDLPSDHGVPSPINPARPTPGQHPLRHLRRHS